MGKEYLEVDWELIEVDQLSDNPTSSIKDKLKETLDNLDDALEEKWNKLELSGDEVDFWPMLENFISKNKVSSIDVEYLRKIFFETLHNAKEIHKDEVDILKFLEENLKV